MTQTFLKLAACKEEIAASSPKTLEHFIVLMYPRNSPYAGVNEARKNCFQKETDPLKTFLLHQMHSVNMCYEQHTKRHLCGASAWRKNKQTNKQTHSQAQDACYELIRCGLQERVQRLLQMCCCHLQCTVLCSSWGDCSQD